MYHLAQLPVPDPNGVMDTYGPFGFGVVAFLLILAAVWAVIIKPSNQQREAERSERSKDLDKIAAIAASQAALGENMRACAQANAKATEDLKVIARVQEAGMQQLERMTARVEASEHRRDG